MQTAEMVGKEPIVDDFDSFPVYRVGPGDVLDLLYSFNVDVKQGFKLLPQDVVKIKFSSVPELNEEQGILPDGSISLPYLGRVVATGLTPQELQNRLKGLYRPILKNPELIVIVSQYGGKIAELKRTITNAPRGQSKLINVRHDGYCNFPLIGELKAGGRTFSELNTEINIRYKEITDDLKVDLLLHETHSKNISILGQVRNPGVFPILRPTTVVEAVSMAGGQSNDSDLTKAVALHKEGREITYKVVDVAAVLSGTTNAPHLFLSPGDVVYVPRRRLAHAAQIAEEIGKITYFNGWGVNFGVSANYDLLAPSTSKTSTQVIR